MWATHALSQCAVVVCACVVIGLGHAVIVYTQMHRPQAYVAKHAMLS